MSLGRKSVVVLGLELVGVGEEVEGVLGWVLVVVVEEGLGSAMVIECLIDWIAVLEINGRMDSRNECGERENGNGVGRSL